MDDDYITRQYEGLDIYGSSGEWEDEPDADELDIPYNNDED